MTMRRKPGNRYCDAREEGPDGGDLASFSVTERHLFEKIIVYGDVAQG